MKAEKPLAATPVDCIVSHVVPYSMGELFEGSFGLACGLCGKRGAMLWLTVDELGQLPPGDSRSLVCEKKLGKPLCKEHQPPLEMVVFRDCG